MGKVMSVVAGKVQRFNVENRAHRVISQDKPKAAPKFESNIKDLERVLRDHPDIVEQAGKKDAHLDERLKSVFVSSSNYVEQKRYVNPEKPLPLNKKHVDYFEMGFKEPEPEKVAPGKCTLRQSIQFISNYQQQPQEWPAERIASEFHLKNENVVDIVNHFRMFAIHIPQDQSKTKKFLIDPLHSQSRDYNKMLEGFTAKPSEGKGTPP